MSKSGPGTISVITAAFVEHSTPLKRFLGRYFSSRQDIEDVVQETYLRAYVEHHRKGLRHPKGFLFRVAKNVALSKLAKKSRQITDYLEDFALAEVSDTEAPIDQAIEAEESLGLYCDALASLPYKCREAFVLRKVHGLSHKEIAERLSMSVSSVEKYLRRGILSCEAYVREHEGRSADTHTRVTAPTGEKKA